MPVSPQPELGNRRYSSLATGTTDMDLVQQRGDSTPQILCSVDEGFEVSSQSHGRLCGGCAARSSGSMDLMVSQTSSPPRGQNVAELGTRRTAVLVVTYI
jgi:hypothetical protein